jgi:SHS2 domain-containing protein
MPDCEIEELGHTAEIGLRIQADTPEQLFACSAHAMFGLLRVGQDTSRPAIHHQVTIESIDGESLMVDWLNELLYLHETTGALFANCTVLHWTQTHLEAQIMGYPPAAPPAVHIKAATYHQLLIQANAGSWVAQIFFDV